MQLRNLRDVGNPRKVRHFNETLEAAVARRTHAHITCAPLTPVLRTKIVVGPAVVCVYVHKSALLCGQRLGFIERRLGLALIRPKQTIADRIAGV